ncbi:putative uncharacterized protein [Waddlia chondrophila 2032/99]|uniref:Tyrosine specific protein phosphatases domain-containing protein n=2 Tax=Waddlia chondrophila TaxID=71667 RepID=D6YS36_WADCW|nr:hypothetical protein [Waddlia chondrophila]ADI38881.1 hypothetical protein wcw_1532 [Waddlia chondrophila WSU 86-1044]CCB90715.1 putative uncharacterized protein [Waddlia chondrophila 2032/99]
MSKWLLLTILLILIFLGLIYPPFAKKYSYLLILNSKNRYELPRNFHTTPFNSSGSGQFSEKELQRMISQIPASNIMIVDLRQEPHGFLNGNAVSWYHEHNWGDTEKNTAEVLHQEDSFVENLRKHLVTIVYHNSMFPVPYLVKTARTEQDIVELQRLQYCRFSITDHRRPKDKHVDAFVHWIKSIPPDTWLHFHCSAGKGRTTTFLAMQDMMLHASKDSLQTIIRRQHDLGGINLHRISDAANDRWKKSHIKKRADFIDMFYDYCREVPSFDMTWSEWVEKKGI